jgi:cytochrome d ubiquinol oxidase subunit I
MKMAATEALWNSENPAAFSLFTIGNEKERRDVWALRIPGLLSFLSFNQFTGEVKGINELQKEYEMKYGPGDYVPPVALTYWSFRAMAGAGILMFLLSALVLWYVLRGKAPSRLLLRVLIPALLLPTLATATGWMVTELGRQPWIVFGLLKTADGVSKNVSAGMVGASLAVFVLLYGALMVADVWLLRKYAILGIEKSH